MVEVMKMSILYTSKTNTKPVSLELDDHDAKVKINGKDCELTRQEYSLLRMLMQHCNVPVSRNELLITAWGYVTPGITRTVDVHIQRLRRKLGAGCIETVYRQGYKLLASPA